MLKNLNIKNIALIDELDLPFYSGLNILTGETGSGKSILINALCFALGARADKSLIRSGCDYAKVVAIFDDVPPPSIEILKSFDIELEDDLIISRKMSLEGKNDIKINGQAITLSMLKQITSTLVDVYGQFEHSNLLDVSQHLNLLDDFIGEELSAHLIEYQKVLKDLKELEKLKQKLGGDEQERKQKIDYLNFQIDELKNAELKPNEFEELQAKQKVLSNIEKIKNQYTLIENNFDGEQGILSQLNLVIKAVNTIQNYIDIKDLSNRLESSSIELSDIAETLKDLDYKTDFNQDEFEQNENRLSSLHFLQKKYSKSIDELIEYLSQIQDEVEFLLNSEKELEKINEKIAQVTIRVEECASLITNLRKSKAVLFQEKIEQNLFELGMKNSKIVAYFSQSPSFLSNGVDNVELLFSANLGEPPKPLSKIISGGEMSRFCLAQKCVQNENNINFTMIFDEIDAGVSGQMGQEIAKKLALISLKNQVICISHLPQIASMADYHYKISKVSENGKTISSIDLIEGENSLKEIARLAGGEDISQYSLQHAQDIKEWANKYKANIK